MEEEIKTLCARALVALGEMVSVAEANGWDNAEIHNAKEVLSEWKTEELEEEPEEEEQPLCCSYRGGDDDPYCVVKWRSDEEGNTAGKCRNCGREVSE